MLFIMEPLQGYFFLLFSFFFFENKTKALSQDFHLNCVPVPCRLAHFNHIRITCSSIIESPFLAVLSQIFHSEFFHSPLLIQHRARSFLLHSLCPTLPDPKMRAKMFQQLHHGLHTPSRLGWIFNSSNYFQLQRVNKKLWVKNCDFIHNCIGTPVNCFTSQYHRIFIKPIFPI